MHYGQYIRQDGPKSHQVKRGTPISGIVIILSVVLGWLASALYRFAAFDQVLCTALLVLLAMLGSWASGLLDYSCQGVKKQASPFLPRYMQSFPLLRYRSKQALPSGYHIHENMIIDFNAGYH